MKKFLNVLGKILILAIISLFLINVILFVKTGDLAYGIWSILLILTINISGNIEITVKER